MRVGTPISNARRIMMLAGRLKRRYEKPMGGLWRYRGGSNFVPRPERYDTTSAAFTFRRLDP